MTGAKKMGTGVAAALLAGGIAVFAINTPGEIEPQFDVAAPGVATTTANQDKFQIFGGTVPCSGTTTGTPVEAGCATTNESALGPGKSYATNGCTDHSPSGGTFACDVVVPPGQAAGTYTVDGFARNAAGERGKLYDADNYQLETGGLLYTSCTTFVGAGPPAGGAPLDVDVDEDGDGWMIGEFSDVIQYFNKDDVPCAADGLVVPSNATYPPYWDVSGEYSGNSTFGESIKVDNVRDVVWFSHGGASVTDAVFSHSRIGEYTPGSPNKETGGSFKMYNIPGIRNEVQGLYIDQDRGWIFATESGQYKDLDGTPVTTGSIIAFDWSSGICTTHPDVCDSTYEWEWGTCDGGVNAGDPCHVADVATDCPASTCTELNADGQLANAMCGVGENPTDDDCFQRWILGEWNLATSHIVGDADGRMYFTNFWGASAGRLDPTTGTSVRYPLRSVRTRSFPNSFIGVGPWEIDITPDGRYVAWGEYFDNSYTRLAVNRSGDAECQSLTSAKHTDLLAHYEFDADECGTAIVDSGLHGNDGTCVGNPTWTGSDGKPDADGALILDGTGDYVDIGTEDLFDFSTSFTVSMWVKPAASQGDSYNSLISKGDTSGFNIRRFNTASSTQANVYAPTADAVTNATDIYDGAWHHVALIYYEGYGKVLWIDGTSERRTVHTVPIASNNYELRVGGNEERGVLSDFTGTVDDIRIYDRALTTEEIDEISNGNDIGGVNPCVERVELPYTGSDLDAFHTHSMEYDALGSFWFTQDAKVRGPAVVQTGLGFIDPAWTHATITDSSDFDPDYNTTMKVFSGMAIDEASGEMWVAEFASPGMGRYVPVEDTAALEVERVTLTLADGEATDSVALSIDTSNAVPFATNRVTTAATTPEAIESYAVDVYFSGGSVVAERAVTSGAIVVEVGVVAFNPGRVKVQSGTWSMGSATTTTDDVTIDAVDLSKAFPIVYGEQNSATHAWSHYNLRPRFTSTTNLRIERGLATASQSSIYDGHYYVVEALHDEWSVQPVSETITGGTGALLPPSEFTAVPHARSFLIGSLMSSENDDNPNKTTVDFTVAQTGDPVAAIAFNRGDGLGGTLNWQGYLVTLAQGQGTVQRAVVTNTAGSQTSALGTSVDATQTDSIVIVAGGTTTNTGSEGGSGTADVPEAFVALDIINSGDDARVQKLDGATDTNEVSFEVITWELP